MIFIPVLRWCLYKLLKCIHDKTFLNFSHKLFCVFYHNVVKILQNTIWQSFDFRDRIKTFDYKALSICIFSFYCHRAAGSHKTLQTKCAMTLKKIFTKKLLKGAKYRLLVILIIVSGGKDVFKVTHQIHILILMGNYWQRFKLRIQFSSSYQSYSLC